MPKPTRIASYVILAISLTLLITSALLVYFIRTNKETDTTITPTPIQTPDKSPTTTTTTQNTVLKIINSGTGQTNPFTFSDFKDIVTILPPWITPTTTPPQPAQTYPGELSFEISQQTPLQQPVRGSLSYAAILPNAYGFITSFQDRYSIFGHYIYNFNTDQNIYKLNTNGYGLPTNFNSVYFDCLLNVQQSTDLQKANFQTSAVGAVGWKSIEISPDGLRLYLGYEQPYVNSSDAASEDNQLNASTYPFGQLAGSVACYTRDADSNGNPTSANWSYKCLMELKNPETNLTFSPVLDPEIPNYLSMSDKFGQIIQSTNHYQTNKRIVAVSCYKSIYIFEENTNLGQHDVIVSLNLENVPNTWTDDDKLSFGKCFVIGDDCLLATVRHHSQDEKNQKNVIISFIRQDNNWSFSEFLTIPDTVQQDNEDFGTSMVMSQDGLYCIIGSGPRINQTTPGKDGSVYFYNRDLTTGKWTNKPFRFQNPDNATTNLAFGQYVAVDKNFFSVLAISYNRDMRYSQPLQLIQSTDPVTKFPGIIIVTIDKINLQIKSDNYQKIIQSNQLNQYYDQSFGCNLQMAFLDKNITNKLMILANSPVNQYIQWYTLTVDNG